MTHQFSRYDYFQYYYDIQSASVFYLNVSHRISVFMIYIDASNSVFLSIQHDFYYDFYMLPAYILSLFKVTIYSLCCIIL